MLLPKKGGLAASLLGIFRYSSWKVVSLKRLSQNEKMKSVGGRKGVEAEGGERQEKWPNYDWPPPGNKDLEDTQVIAEP